LELQLKPNSRLVGYATIPTQYKTSPLSVVDQEIIVARAGRNWINVPRPC